MKALLQRVTYARVEVSGEIIGAIEQGILVFVGVEKGDDSAKAQRLVERILNYRIFSDEDDKMNLNVGQISGGVLAVSQFTLAADTRKGNRPGFSTAAPPDVGEALYDEFVEILKGKHANVATGKFGADMKISLLNDGPVTFLLGI